MSSNDWSVRGKDGKHRCRDCKHTTEGHATRLCWLLKAGKNVGRMRMHPCAECDCKAYDWIEIWEDAPQQQRATAKWKDAEGEFAEYGELDLDHTTGLPSIEIPDALLGAQSTYRQVQQAIEKQRVYDVTPYGGIEVGEHDRVIVKQCWKYPVPTAYEVKLLLDSMPDYSQPKLGLALIAMEGCRPVEVTRLRWLQFTIKDGRVLDFRHFVNKPVGRTTRMGKNYEEKELRKPVHALSPWLSDQLIGYARIAPQFASQHMFCWTESNGLTKYIEKLRKKIKEHPDKYGPEYACFFDSNSYVRVGENQPIPYRINAYSLRRFSMTFHYYTTFKQDPIKTAKFFGHSEAATTLGHYIQPKDAIGLTQKMIDQGITIDQFILLQGKKQTRLVDYDVLWPQRFHDAAQSKIADHKEDRI